MHLIGGILSSVEVEITMFWRTDINKSLRVEDQNIQVRFESGVGITPSNANSCKGRWMINVNPKEIMQIL